jgi:peptidoglycan/xylan/chitin deacetylase (PgdA/CDA1 family)
MSQDRLVYPRRRAGLDHEWFAHAPTRERPRLAWPGNKPVALWITVPIEIFPLETSAQPLRPLGALPLGYPDLWNASNRDYGMRIGIYRIMRALDGYRLRATAAVNATAALQYSRVMAEIAARDWEFMANGFDMGNVHHGGLAPEAELALIRKAHKAVSAVAGAPVRGWHSPGRSQSQNTLALLAGHGFSYVTDWANDDMPYEVTTTEGKLCAMPLTYECSDRQMLVQHTFTVDEYAEQVWQAYLCLAEEAERYGSGRILSLSATPWILGYPHRIAAFERLLGRIVASGAVWNATGAEIAQVFTSSLSGPAHS